MQLTYVQGAGPETIDVARAGERLTITIGERRFEVRVTACGDGRLTFLLGDRVVAAEYARGEGGLYLWLDGTHHLVRTPLDDAASPSPGSAAGASDGRVLTPMPGKVVAVNVSLSDRVAAGQALVVLESMKMQNDIVAPADGVVIAVHHEVGDNVEYGDVLVELELSAESVK